MTRVSVCVYIQYIYNCPFYSQLAHTAYFCVGAEALFDICALLGISCSSACLISTQEQLFSLCLSDT